ncbi:UNVERIFIED_CONTAM: hypothetical protein ABID98_001027 [Brevibacillus sp. OAP136]
MITIQRQIPVKLILTEQSRERLRHEYEAQIRQVQEELRQWEFYSKRLLHEAQGKSQAARQQAEERIAREEKNRREKLERIQFQLEQSQQLPIGSELPYTTVQSSVQVQIGDNWNDIMTGTEIIVKNGIVHAIRQGGERNGSNEFLYGGQAGEHPRT